MYGRAGVSSRTWRSERIGLTHSPFEKSWGRQSPATGMSEAMEHSRLYNVAKLSFEWSAVVGREAIAGPGWHGRRRGGAAGGQPQLRTAPDGGADAPARDPAAPGGAGEI